MRVATHALYLISVFITSELMCSGFLLIHTTFPTFRHSAPATSLRNKKKGGGERRAYLVRCSTAARGHGAAMEPRCSPPDRPRRVTERHCNAAKSSSSALENLQLVPLRSALRGPSPPPCGCRARSSQQVDGGKYHDDAFRNRRKTGVFRRKGKKKNCV